MLLNANVINKRVIEYFVGLEDRLKNKHSNFYLYDKAVYRNNDNKITITCPIHGDFEQTVKVHLKGSCCPKCSNKRIADSKRKTTEEFIEEAKLVHGNKYIYDKVKYTNTHGFVTITCRTHGDFNQRAKEHLRGYNCSKCAGCYSHTNKEYIEKVKLIHNNKYEYSKTNYENMTSKIIITCKIHGDFKQTATHHTQGHGCPACSKAGFDQTKPAILYYISIDNGTAYKIGITNRSVEKRFQAKDQYRIKIIKTWHYENGLDALNEETRILREFKEYKYQGPPLLSGTKTNKMFYKDILVLDKLP